MRLIDADALMDAFNESDRDSALAEYVFNTFIKLLYMSPTIDAVEVVRCKECKHRDPEDKKCDCGGFERAGCIFAVDDDYFCSFGERRT